MDQAKAEFQRLVRMTGWTNDEVAAKLGITANAVKNLLNPEHPNKPTAATLRLFKLIIEEERRE